MMRSEQEDSLWLMTVQAIADSTTSLAEISVVPLDFLLILLLLFTFMVLDRLAYTLGSHMGKVCTLNPKPAFEIWVQNPLEPASIDSPALQNSEAFWHAVCS